MFTTLIAAALAAAAPAAASADPHAGHHPAGHQGGHEHKAGHDGKGCCDHKGADGKAMECCKGKTEADKAKCCAEHGDHAKHGEHKK